MGSERRRARRPASVALAILAAGCASTPASPVDQQREFARVLEPESLAPPARPAALARRGVIRIRAYVDDAYRSATRDPDARLRQTVDDASAILEAQLGASLELAQIRPFPPGRDPAGEELPAALEALRGLDDAAGVDLVVGFIGAAPVVTNALHRLGYADVLGRYAVVRALDDAAEARAIADALNRMPDDEVAGLLARRRRHKAAIVLLHEIAHDLGGVHVTDPEVVLFPSYSIDQNRLDEDALALLERGLAWLRATDDGARVALAKELEEQVKMRRDRLDAAGVDEAVQVFEARQAPADVLVLAPDAARAFNEAVAAARSGDVAGAWRTLRPLADEDGADPRVLRFACALASRDGVFMLDGKARCDRALAARPDDLAAAAAAARFAVRSGDGAEEAQAFDTAAARVAVLTARPAPAGHDVDGLLDVASVARVRGRLTLAEDALALTGAAGDDERERVRLAGAAPVCRAARWRPPTSPPSPGRCSPSSAPPATPPPRRASASTTTSRAGAPSPACSPRAATSPSSRAASGTPRPPARPRSPRTTRSSRRTRSPGSSTPCAAG